MDHSATKTVDEAPRKLADSAERKLVPVVAACAAFTLVNYLDRTNLALASVSMAEDVGIQHEQYGLAAALFFLPYALLQVPCVMLMAKVKSKSLWLAGLLIAWGAVAAGMAGITGPTSLYVLRVLLGVFEAGALPCMWAYLSHLYPKGRLTMPLGFIMGMIVLSQAISPLLGAGMLAMNGLGGLAGWQWLFLLEGLMAIIVGFGWIFVPKDLESVRGMTVAERLALRSEMKVGDAASTGNQLAALKVVVTNPTIYILGLTKFLRGCSFYAIIFWVPLMIKWMLGFSTFGPATAGHAVATTSQNVEVALWTTLPYGVAAVVQLLNSWHSQRTNERRFHIAVFWALGCVSLLFLPLALSSQAAGLAVLTLVAVGVTGTEGVSPAHFMALQGGEKGVGMAIVNSCSALGGFVAPYLVSALVASSGNYNSSMYMLGALIGAAAIMVAAFPPSVAERWAARRQAELQLTDLDCTVDAVVDVEAAVRTTSSAKIVAA